MSRARCFHVLTNASCPFTLVEEPLCRAKCRQWERRVFESHQLKLGESHATVVIVEFPACRDAIHLDGLPPGHYPIYPYSCPIKVDTYVSGWLHTVSIQRHQMPLQLRFSRTAHGAQGKTLTAVGSDLNFGGAMAYVIASRARTRQGLALLQPVTLDALNKPPARGG